MKVRLDEKRLSSNQLEKLINEEVKKHGAELCKMAAEKQTREVVATLMYLFHEQHWHKDRIQKYFNMMCEIYERPAVFGKTVKGKDIIEFISDRYELDFDKLNPKFEVNI